MTMIMGIIIFFVLNVIYGKVSLESKRKWTTNALDRLREYNMKSMHPLPEILL